MRRTFFIICLFLLDVTALNAKTVYVLENDDLNRIFLAGKAKYILRFEHQFRDTLFIPQNSELIFEGGHLCGPIVFDDTRLSGRVNLKGSSIKGTIQNSNFDASWLCTMDGVSDDARNINEIIEVCNRVHFPKGKYKLVSSFLPNGKIDEKYFGAVTSHIGIYKNNVALEGEEGAEFIIDKPASAICVFSQPNQIANSIRNIKISGITFNVNNDGENFYEFAHTIKTKGVNGLIIKNCIFKDFLGDAISLSHYYDTPETGERSLNQNVKILNNVILGGSHYNNRNGISVGSGKCVLIKSNIIKNTSRKDMPGGIDIEPNNSAYTIDNIRIENNLFDSIGGSGGAICVGFINGGPAHYIYIVKNKVYNSSNGIQIFASTENTSDNFVIKGNYMDKNTRPYRFVGSGISNNWSICDNIFDKPCMQSIPGDIKVHNLTVKNNKKKE